MRGPRETAAAPLPMGAGRWSGARAAEPTERAKQTAELRNVCHRQRTGGSHCWSVCVVCVVFPQFKTQALTCTCARKLRNYGNYIARAHLCVRYACACRCAVCGADSPRSTTHRIVGVLAGECARRGLRTAALVEYFWAGRNPVLLYNQSSHERGELTCRRQSKGKK